MIDYAKCCFANGAYRESLMICENILRQNAFDPQAIELASISSLKLKDARCYDYCRRAYEGRTNSFYLAFNLAMAAKEVGRFQESRSILENLVKLQNNPLQWQCLRELASVYRLEGMLDNAYQAYVLLLQQTPKDLDLWNEVSSLYIQANPQKALQTCIECHNKLLEIIKQLEENPNNGDSKENLASLDDIPEYKKPLQERLDKTTNAKLPEQINPEIQAIRNFLNTTLDLKIAKLFFLTRQDQEAIKYYEMLQIPNSQNAEFWRNFAYTLECQGRYEDARQAYENAISINPHPTYKFDLAYLLMRLGDIKENWQAGVELYENRLFYAASETFAPNLYQQAFDAFKQDQKCFEGKKIFVYCEQGFGDTLMYCRLLERVCESAEEVLFLPQSAMYPFFRYCLKQLRADGDTIFAKLKVLNALPKNFDYALPICSLPFFYQVDSLETINALKSPIVPLAKTAKKNAKKTIGFYWYSEFTHREKTSRNFPVELFLEAFEGLDYKIVSLQFGADGLPKKIENRGKNFQSWLDTYDALADIDYLVGIDSSPGHLGMLLGIPTIMVIDSRFDWRFGRYEKPTPLFYENMKDKVKFVIYKNHQETKEELHNVLKELKASK